MFKEFELFEKLYFHELERKQQLENNIALPTGTIVAAYGVLGYYFTHFHFAGKTYFLDSFVGTAFGVSAVSTFAMLALATFWCLRSALGSAYEYLPGAQTLRSYYVELKDWHLTQNPKLVALKSENDFQDYLLEAMARCSQRNWQTNLVRSEELHRTKRFALFALTSLAVVAVAYYIDFWYNPSQIRP